MNFNFKELYKTYTSAELLQIVQNPDKYQPSAVEAAKEILEGRTVTDEDIAQSAAKPEPSLQLVASSANVFKKLTGNKNKWVIVILSVCILKYIPLLLNAPNTINQFLSCSTCRFSLVYIGALLDIVFMPIVFYLFYKEKRIGWILLFVAKLFPLFVWVLYIYREDLEMDNILVLRSFLDFAINFLIVALLWRKELDSIFKLNTRVKLYCTVSVVIVWLISLFFK